jgi:hypothetical protein
MTGAPLAELKTAAKNFLYSFAGTQDRDRLGIVSFATSVTVPCALTTGFVAPAMVAVDALVAVGATNAEDALDQANDPLGLTDPAGRPPLERPRQFVVFFSDGRPTAFRGDFLRSGAGYDGVACATGNCVSGDGGSTYGNLARPNAETWLGIDPTTTGDGLGTVRCASNGPLVSTTRWYVFDTDPVPGYAATANCIPDPPLHDQVCSLARSLALRHAQELKDAGVTIFTIGLGANVDEDLMRQLASSSDCVYHAEAPAQLPGLFAAVALAIQGPTPARRESIGALKVRYAR